MSTKKNRNIIAIIILAAAFLSLLVWWRSRPTPYSVEQAGPAQSSPIVTGQGGQSAVVNADQLAPQAAQPSPTQKPSPELRRAFETLNHNPVEFYGRAIDQFGEPVAGAEVRGTLLVNTGTSGGQKKAQTTTDAQGYFQFTELTGQDLGIGISKEGYEYRRKSTSFSYSYFEADHKRHIPDPKNPVIFILWKKQGAEKLIHYERGWEWRFPVNAGPVRINLETGKLGGPEADLIVTVSRNPLRMPFGARGFAWQATVEVVSGGLLRAGERDYYNLAPESGYQPIFEHKQESQNAMDSSVKWTWSRDIEDTFFISSRSSKNFARVNLRISPHADQNEGDNLALISGEIWLNPSGSRNLEFDPKKAIRPAP